MYQPFTFSVALRYLRARSRNSFISFISLVSMLGIALAVAVLIVVMSVINGFETTLQERILGMTADATITGYEGPLSDWGEMRELALERDDVLGAAPFVEGQAMLASRDALLGVGIRGIVPELEPETSAVADMLVKGTLDVLTPGSYKILIGSAVAAELELGVGDKVILVLPKARVTPAGLIPRMRSFEVAGVFDVGMYDYDRGLAFVHFDDASLLYQTSGRANGLSLKVRDLYSAGTVVNEFARSLGGPFYVSDWTRQQANIFRSIQLTKPILFIMLSLVIGVAAFNIISTLVMVVREKRGDIAILRSFGATPRNILSIFATQGSAIGLIGTLSGLVLGLVVAASLADIVSLVQAWFGIDLLSAEVYKIGDLPTQVRVGETARICLLALVLTVVATFYPASMASRQPPAEALRYE